MNKDQIKGGVKEVAGKVQSGIGKATGSTEHRVKGAVKEAEGVAQKKYGDAKENLEDAADEVRATRRDVKN